jgi:hypothetical protein
MALAHRTMSRRRNKLCQYLRRRPQRKRCGTRARAHLRRSVVVNEVSARTKRGSLWLFLQPGAKPAVPAGPSAEAASTPGEGKEGEPQIWGGGVGPVGNPKKGGKLDKICQRCQGSTTFSRHAQQRRRSRPIITFPFGLTRCLIAQGPRESNFEGSSPTRSGCALDACTCGTPTSCAGQPPPLLALTHVPAARPRAASHSSKPRCWILVCCCCVEPAVAGAPFSLDPPSTAVGRVAAASATKPKLVPSKTSGWSATSARSGSIHHARRSLEVKTALATTCGLGAHVSYLAGTDILLMAAQLSGRSENESIVRAVQGKAFRRRFVLPCRDGFGEDRIHVPAVCT